MPTIIIQPEQWNLEPVTEEEKKRTPLLDPHELDGMRRRYVNATEPFVAILEEPANHYSSVHYHTASEVMIVLKGRMLLNGEWCGPGAIAYIGENEEYWHATGAEPCVVALLRPGDRARLVPGADARAELRKREAAEGLPVS